MTKGKFGFSTTAIAVIAFAFVALQQPIAVLLIAGFVLLAEKDEWLNRQAVQAVLLTVVYYLAVLATDWMFGGLGRLFGLVKLYDVQDVMNIINSIVSDILSLALVIVAVIALLRVLRGKDAGLPWLSKVADGNLLAAFKTPQPVQKELATPVVKQCPTCSAPLPENAEFCTQCGTKAE